MLEHSYTAPSSTMSSQSKENIIIGQNAAGSAANQAYIEELKSSIGISNIFMGIVVLIVLLAASIGAYKVYKRCHRRWIREEVNSLALQRATSMIRRGRSQKSSNEGGD
ncbi:unnamed protein product, partial [Brenthis ino]